MKAYHYDPSEQAYNSAASDCEALSGNAELLLIGLLNLFNGCKINNMISIAEAQTDTKFNTQPFPLLSLLSLHYQPKTLLSQIRQLYTNTQQLLFIIQIYFKRIY